MASDDRLHKVRKVVEALDGYATGDEYQRPIEAAVDILRGLLAEGEAPATSKRAEDTMPPGWVQCPECLAGFPIEDGIKGGAPVPEALTVDEIHDCADETIGCHDACASDEMVERLYNFAKSVERKVRQKIKPQEPK